MVTHGVEGVGNRVAMIWNRPASVSIAEVTRIPIIMAVPVVPRIAKKETKRRTVRIPKIGIVRSVVQVIRVRIWISRQRRISRRRLDLCLCRRIICGLYKTERLR